jgi:hypothetical protein
MMGMSSLDSKVGSIVGKRGDQKIENEGGEHLPLLLPFPGFIQHAVPANNYYDNILGVTPSSKIRKEAFCCNTTSLVVVVS